MKTYVLRGLTNIAGECKKKLYKWPFSCEQNTK